MKFRAKILIFIILIALISALSYQTYWLIKFYNSQYTKMEAAINSAMHNAGYKEITLNITNNKPIVSSIQPDSIVSEIINVDLIIANSQNTPSIELGISAHNYHTKVDSLKKNGFKLFDSLLNIELSQLNINIPYYLEYVNLKKESIISNFN